uniref:Equilibrative nucleoside transporter 1 n=1 Tax=Globodera rostochiensis TaxID=31243 RepID=A0A914GXN6_GLORO
MKDMVETDEQQSDRIQLQLNSQPITNTSSNTSPQQNSFNSALKSQSRSSDGKAAAEDSVPFIDRETSEEMEQNRDSGSPPDRLNLVYLIVLLHGIGMLLPWNTFLTIGTDYYVNYKFHNVSSDEYYKSNFFNYLTIFAQIPNLLLSFMNLFVVVSGGLYRRIYFTLSVIVGLCLVTVAMIYFPTDNWTFGFFVFTMATVVLLNSASGVYQNSIWGLVADFPGSFANAIVIGNNLCGILMVVLYILIVVLVRANTALAASIYFMIALFTVLLCIVSFHFLPKLRFYKYHVEKAARARESNGTNILHEEETGEATVQRKMMHPSAKTYIAIFSEVCRQLFDVWLVFFVTLALFPTVLLNVKMGEVSPFIYNQKTSEILNRQLTIFLNFNLFATIGSWLAGYFHWPSPEYLSLPIAFRLVFLPLFWFCNYQPESTIRQFVFIYNEWAFIILIALMALTHGYWSSLSMIYAPKHVDDSKSQIVGMMSGFFLVLGIASGILFSFVEPCIVCAFENFLSLF